MFLVWARSGCRERFSSVTEIPSRLSSISKYFSEVYKIIAMHAPIYNKSFRLHNVRAGYVLYRALVVFVAASFNIAASLVEMQIACYSREFFLCKLSPITLMQEISINFYEIS